MALIYCRECGNQISEEAAFCVRCGAETNSEKELPARKRFGGRGPLILFMLGWLILMARCISNEPSPTAPQNAGSSNNALTPLSENKSSIEKNATPPAGDLSGQLARLPKFEKPLFTRSGFPICDTEDDMKAIMALLEAGVSPTKGNSPGCHATDDGSKLIVIRDGPFMSLRYYVRILTNDGRQEDGWVSVYSIRN